MKPKDRLRLYIKHIESNPRAFEISIGVNNGTVGKINTSIKFDILERISKKYPDLNLEWLQIGTGEMLKDANPEFDSLENDLVRRILNNSLMIAELDKRDANLELKIMERSADQIQTNLKMNSNGGKKSG